MLTSVDFDRIITKSTESLLQQPFSGKNISFHCCKKLNDAIKKVDCRPWGFPSSSYLHYDVDKWKSYKLEVGAGLNIVRINLLHWSSSWTGVSITEEDWGNLLDSIEAAGQSGSPSLIGLPISPPKRRGLVGMGHGQSVPLSAGDKDEDKGEGPCPKCNGKTRHVEMLQTKYWDCIKCGAGGEVKS